MTTSHTELRSSLRRVAELLTATSATKQAAFDQARAADTEVFELLLEELKPTVTALSSRIPVAALIEPGEKGTTQLDSYDDRRGFLLAGDAVPRRDASGRYQGRALYILTDGTLVELEHTGTWRKTEGTTSPTGTWSSAIRSTTPPEAIRTFRLDDVTDRLSKAIQAAADGNTRAADELADRARRVSAIATLLRR